MPSLRREFQVGCSSRSVPTFRRKRQCRVAGRSPWRGAPARSRASRSGRSPTVSVTRRRRSRRTSRPASRRRRGRSRPVPRGVSRLPRLHPAAQRQGRCLRVLQGVPCGCDRASVDPGARARSDARLGRGSGRLPSSYDWSRTQAHRRGGAALERLSAGDRRSASVVTGVFGSWAAARSAAADARRDAGAGIADRDISHGSLAPATSPVAIATARVGNPREKGGTLRQTPCIYRGQRQRQPSNGTQRCEHPDGGAVRTSAVPEQRPPAGLGASARHDRSAGSVDRLPSAAGADVEVPGYRGDSRGLPYA